jgi:DNA-binding winged helix-turn-helix (wHTH) protein
MAQTLLPGKALMDGDRREIGLIGVPASERASCEAWARMQALPVRSFRIDVPTDVDEIRQLEFVVIAALEQPLLAIAECARLHTALPSMPLALLGPAAPELEAAAQRVGGFCVRAGDASKPSFWSGLRRMAHARCLLGRSGALTHVSAHLAIDRSARLVYVEGRTRALSATKFDLFCYMIDHAGRAISASELVRHRLLLPSQAARFKGLIAELRGYLGTQRDCIQAVPGYGYRLEVEADGRSTGTSAPLPQHTVTVSNSF